MNEKLVRFDIRLQKDDYVNLLWKEKEMDRNVYLLRPELEWPLSVDPLVWPSIFDSKIFRQDSFLRHRLPSEYIEVDPSVDDGEYWRNLDHMKAYYEAHKQPNLCGVFVAIHLFSEKDLDSDMIPYVIKGNIQCVLELGPTTPTKIPPGSQFLGYDIADAAQVSGLTNCGYTPEDRQRLEPVWASRLNSFGLLETLEDAVEFRSVCDSRIEDHAPFWVYGISRLPYS